MRRGKEEEREGQKAERGEGRWITFVLCTHKVGGSGGSRGGGVAVALLTSHDVRAIYQAVVEQNKISFEKSNLFLFFYILFLFLFFLCSLVLLSSFSSLT